ncbi:MAG: hypothetical protein IEMM0002_0807 [bacterium]|nr:MAG: hypothetical protein IEMM0002_0807 [bacterium]
MGLVRAYEKRLTLPFEWRLAGYEIIDCQGKFVAPVYDLLCNGESGDVRYLIAEIGGTVGISGRKVLLPKAILMRAGSGQVITSATLEYILESPPVDDPENPTSGEEKAILGHYGQKAGKESAGEEDQGK